ncbi:ATPase/histidine kinase/DNA gyrase B/HSP90 domain protein [delta proteobacterium NaphS2]|nr:ATPase/histidine kinase/DNA gyrase B/HSP90 domain protein [delta proteobacterium NaphS2]
MGFLNNLKPAFWDQRKLGGAAYRSLFDFRRTWYAAVFVTSAVVLAPLIFMAVMDYRATRHDVESEILLTTSRLVSNIRRTISYFFDERRCALDFIVNDNNFRMDYRPEHLEAVLENLKKSFGGFVDLGLIDPQGIQRVYAGPYHLTGKDYSNQEWFKQVVKHGAFISDAFSGFRHIPHIVMAVKYRYNGGSFGVLRATLDTENFVNLLSNLEIDGHGDAFMINHEGVLQTPTQSHGKVLQRISLPIPKDAPETRVFEWVSANGTPLVIGYRYITDTPFILMVVKNKPELLKAWDDTRKELIGFLLISAAFILFVILWGATYLVNRIFQSDQKLIVTLHQIEYTNKMASIGRLAAGVAHEINNPLAIINEKAGLMKDLFTFKEEYKQNEMLMGLVDSILNSVTRCGRITKRLLGFARHMDVSIQTVNVNDIIREVLGFLNKEAEYRSIQISIDISDDIPDIETDAGRLQQVILNIINNAFAAMDNNGHLQVKAGMADPENIALTISDDGCGIPESDIKRVFEPFFSTKTGTGGTGLGLSITYGLVEQLGGTIDVTSEVNRGTTFSITLPLAIEEKEMKNSCVYS